MQYYSLLQKGRRQILNMSVAEKTGGYKACGEAEWINDKNLNSALDFELHIQLDQPAAAVLVHVSPEGVAW